MLLAIDLGNTDLKCAIWQDNSWANIWRRPTIESTDSKELADWVHASMAQAGLNGLIEQVGCASVVPALNSTLDEMARHLSSSEAFFLTAATIQGLPILYEPVTGLGADRIANVLGALGQYKAPLIVVDFGSATTLDVATSEGFRGGSIMPGLLLQMASLAGRTAQLQEVAIQLPPNPIGNSTQYGIQSGVVLGHLAAVEGLLARMQKELGEPATVLGTGGYSHLFLGATEAIHHFVPTLTLDGIRQAVLS